MEKVLFALDFEDGDDWPPVASEGVWCERVGAEYRLLNAPFFIKDLAVGDVFSAEPDPVNHHVFEFQITEESGHSLVWMINDSDIDVALLKSEILALGCRIEEFEKFSVIAVDVPSSVDRVSINTLVDSAEKAGLAIAYPVWRHEAESI